MSYDNQFKYAACLWAAGTIVLIAIVLLVCALNTASNEYKASRVSVPHNGVVIDGITYDKRGRVQK